MMAAEILIIPLSLSYLVLFIARNALVEKKTGVKVSIRDTFAFISILLGSTVFAIAISSVYSVRAYFFFRPFMSLRGPSTEAAGIVLMSAGIIFGWISSGNLRSSWRVGIGKNQRTDLVQDGTYGHLRNPYFLSMMALYASLFLMRPSAALLAAALLGSMQLHILVMREEKYLSRTHGKAYEEYRSRTGRYFPRFM